MFETGHFLTIPQIITAVRRRWFPASVLSFLIVCIAAVVIMLVRDKYESEGSIYLKAGRATLTVDPTASTSQTSTLLDTRQAEIQSIKEMLGTRQLVEQVAEQVGIDRIIDQRSSFSRWMDEVGEIKTSILGKKSVETLSEEEVIALQRLEFCVSYIQKQLKIRASKDGNTVSISCRAHTPFLARDIVAEIMKQFNEQYILVHKSKGSVDFFKDQLAKANTLLSEREQVLRGIKDELGIMTVEDKRSLIQQELSALQSELINSEASLTSVIAEIEHLATKMSEQPEFINQESTDKPSYASELMRQNLYALEVTENELRAKYHDSHPQVIQVRDKIEKSREIFDKQGIRTGETKKMANPIRLDLEKNLITAKGRQESLMARIAGVKEDFNEAQKKLLEMNQAEVRIAETSRLVDQARDDYRILAKKLEEARIQDKMDENVLSDLATVQPATLVLEKVFPQRGMMLVAVGAGSLFIGLAFAVWRDQTAYRAAFTPSTGIPVVVGGRSVEIERRSAPETSQATLPAGTRSRSTRQTAVVVDSEAIAKETAE